MAGAVLSEHLFRFLAWVSPAGPDWGTMIEEARGLDILYNSPHVLVFPGIAIALTYWPYFIGDGLREYLDPKHVNDSKCPPSRSKIFQNLSPELSPAKGLGEKEVKPPSKRCVTSAWRSAKARFRAHRSQRAVRQH